jgi:NADH dehydrogenase
MILVTGATGAMGSVLVRELHRINQKVRAVSLPGDPFVARVKDTAAEIVSADIADASQCTGICEGIDTVYHLAAIIISRDEMAFDKINVEGTRNIVEQALKARVRHFIYISSASVTYGAPTPYSRSKKAAEQIVIDSGLPYTILRPTLVYGELGGQEFDMYLAYLARFPIVPFIGSGKALKRPVFVDDVTAGLLAVCNAEVAIGKTYNLSGGEAISMRDFSRLCLRLMGQGRKPLLHLPVWLCLLIARGMQLVMKDPPLKWQVIAGIIQDANLDPGQAMAELGYNSARVSECLPRFFPRKRAES